MTGENALQKGEQLAAAAGEWLRRRGLKLVTAESCTGGLVGHRLTNIPGSSEYYLGGILAYAYEAKERLLGVRRETLLRHGAVSEEVVLEMARGVRQAMAGEYSLDQLVGISVSGVAGPGGGSPEKPVGTVWIGLSAPDLERAWLFHWDGDRVENKELSANQALSILVAYLKGEVSNEG